VHRRYRRTSDRASPCPGANHCMRRFHRNPPTGSPERSGTCNLQPATCNPQLATFNTLKATTAHDHHFFDALRMPALPVGDTFLSWRRGGGALYRTAGGGRHHWRLRHWHLSRQSRHARPDAVFLTKTFGFISTSRDRSPHGHRWRCSSARRSGFSARLKPCDPSIWRLHLSEVQSCARYLGI